MGDFVQIEPVLSMPSNSIDQSLMREDGIILHGMMTTGLEVLHTRQHENEKSNTNHPQDCMVDGRNWIVQSVYGTLKY